MVTLFHRPSTIFICSACARSFSTSSSRAVSLQWDKNDPEALAETLPPYPHGPTRWYKQSRLGLYGGQRIQFGNNVGTKIAVKTRRSWHPNVFNRKLYSKALSRTVQVRVTTRVLKTIDKLGGLDEYLLGDKEARIKELGESGWWLRWAIMQTPVIKERFAEERKQLGIPETVAEDEEVEAVEAQEVISEATDAEVEEAVAEGEAVATDNAFQVEQTPELPPLKFRVGPGQHVMLTKYGWLRTRPDPSRRADIVKGRLRKRYEELLLPHRVAEFEEAVKDEAGVLSKELSTPTKPVGDKVKAYLLKQAQKQWRKDFQQYAEDEYQRLQEVKKAKKRKRGLEKRKREQEDRQRSQEQELRN